MWRRVDPLFNDGRLCARSRLWNGRRCVALCSRAACRVYGIDSSPRHGRNRREGAGSKLSVAQSNTCSDLECAVDGVISNFGALNCLASLTTVAGALGRMVRSGGSPGALLHGTCLPLGDCFLFLQRKGSEGISPVARHEWILRLARACSIHLARQLCRLLQTHFRLLGFYGIGVSVPPSYVGVLE